MFEIMFYPLLVLIGIALLSGAYGCQMLWHKVACLGDTLSHGALLGLVVGAFLGFPEKISLLLLSVVWALFLWLMTKNKKNTTDTIMAFLMQSSMALVIFLSAFGYETSLMHAFLGDVLLIDKKDFYFILFLDFMFGLVLFFCWKRWVLIAISENLAKGQKIIVWLWTLIFFVCIGFLMATSMQYLGALLAPAFFIMPALCARLVASSPEKMAFFATLIAIFCALSGCFLSFLLDFPTGACIIITNLVLYLLMSFLTYLKNCLAGKSLIYKGE